MSEETNATTEAIGAIEQSNMLLVELSKDLDLEHITDILNCKGFSAHIIDRAPVFSKDTLMHALYQSLRLPAHFGFNWDALQDCLVALEEEEESEHGHILAFQDLSLLKEDIDTFREVIEDANEIRGENKAPPVRLVALSAS